MTTPAHASWLTHHFETVHFLTSQGESAHLTLWVTTPQALPGLEAIPHRDWFLASWHDAGGLASGWKVTVRAGCADTLTAMGLPADVASCIDAILWTELDDSAQYWRRRGWDTGDLFP
jgi:hypothetical protein